MTKKAKRTTNRERIARAGSDASPPKAKKVAKPKVAKAPRDPAKMRSGSKTALIADMLKRPEGCTAAEVLAATGWPTVSMPQQAKAAGLDLLKEKDGKVSRYRAAA